MHAHCLCLNHVHYEYTEYYYILHVTTTRVSLHTCSMYISGMSLIENNSRNNQGNHIKTNMNIPKGQLTTPHIMPPSSIGQK